VLNKIVVHYSDGRVLKGTTADFSPGRPLFHLEVKTPAAANPSGSVVDVRLEELKAVFFVKDFAGNPVYDEVKSFDGSPGVQGRKIEVQFTDGEMLVGTTMGYEPDRPAFFLVPADPGSNNERCFIVRAAVKGVKFL
jgi:Family of unknown function (DUF6982)